ncbi:MAG: SDR family oxidoreductase [Alphaproteobacteria bacterium]|jgi:NAD(P)-dependent dehydrogenase (short-subunit alcohol dehydrogenase family)|nr:SDR family oxidoreductase [Alphaproteobacteria bacterium]
MADLPLDGHNAIVTGASSGLGRHFALTLARAGAKVALAARRTDKLQELADEIADLDGHGLPVKLDVTDAASVRAAVETAETELGPITILINNSGIALPAAAVDISEEDWDAVIDTNLKGAWLVAQEVARHMIRLKHGGSIVNIASALFDRVQSRLSTYAISKAGVVQMTKALALELARHDIRVNAIAPGYIVTEMNREFLTSPRGQEMMRQVPQRRFGELEDLDAPLLLLAGEGSRYITGAVIIADGGHGLAIPD